MGVIRDIRYRLVNRVRLRLDAVELGACGDQVRPCNRCACGARCRGVRYQGRLRSASAAQDQDDEEREVDQASTHSSFSSSHSHSPGVGLAVGALHWQVDSFNTQDGYGFGGIKAFRTESNV